MLISIRFGLHLIELPIFNKIHRHVTLIRILYVSGEDNSDKTTCDKWQMVILSHCDKYTKWYTQHNGTELVERKLTFLSF